MVDQAVRFAVVVAHAAHVPERREALARLMAALEGDPLLRDAVVSLEVEAAPGRPHEWSERQWRRSMAHEGATHGMFLNDDLLPCAGFLQVARAAVSARAGEIVSLYASPPLCQRADEARRAWVTTPDGLIGNAYVVPLDVLGDFLYWREESLLPGAVERLSEDQLINLYAMATERLIWHTSASLVTHDESVASCYGNKPVPAIAPRDDWNVIDWTQAPIHGGRYFTGNHRHLLGFITPEHWRAYRCPERYYDLERDRPILPGP